MDSLGCRERQEVDPDASIFHGPSMEIYEASVIASERSTRSNTMNEAAASLWNGRVESTSTGVAGVKARGTALTVSLIKFLD